MKIHQRAFTLIELLIVIAIIGILMGMLFPALSSVIDNARKAQAKNDVTQIATAVMAYETEYGKLPPGGGDVNKALVETLAGITTTDNPRKVVFLDVQAAKKGRSGTNSSGTFVDPWGGKYQIAIDNTDYDNTVSAGSPPENIRKKVGVWNDTSSYTNLSIMQKKIRYVTSWQ